MSEIEVERKKPGPKPKRTEESQIEEARARRERRRADLGAGRMHLEAPKRPGFVRRWVNMVTGRVQRFEDNGWDPVQDSGSDVRHVGGKKDSTQAILMEIPEEFAHEDRKQKLAKVVDPRQMAENRSKPKTDDSPEEYVPGNRDSALSVDKLR